MMRANTLFGVLLVATAGLLVGLPPASADSPAKQQQQHGKEQHTKEQRASARSAPARDKRPQAARRVKAPPVGRMVQRLPPQHQSIRVKRKTYRYHNGVFYRQSRDNRFVVIRAPLGARVSRIPLGYISFYIGPSRYYYSNYTYYFWDTPTREYIVVEKPEGADNALVSASESEFGDLYIYPNRGQSDSQRESDRYGCYLWAFEETGFDPSDRAADETREMADELKLTEAELTLQRSNYERALSACLEGRGYTVR